MSGRMLVVFYAYMYSYVCISNKTSLDGQRGRQTCTDLGAVRVGQRLSIVHVVDQIPNIRWLIADPTTKIKSELRDKAI